MNKLNDDNIKKIIKETIKEPNIKLTSNQIWANYEQQKQILPKRKSICAMPNFRFALSFVVTVLAVGSLLYFNRVSNLQNSGESDEPDISFTDVVSQKMLGGTEGEFVFMSFSAASYTPNNGFSPSPSALRASSINARVGNGSNNGQTNATVLEAVLDQTMPLVNDFYKVEQNFNYEKNEGIFTGEFGVYTVEYIVDESTRILGNVSFEEDESEFETEIEGEIIVSGVSYLYEGETEIDLEDNETDISIKITYNENLSLEISSENQGQKQEFNYILIEDDDEVFNLSIETFRHGKENQYFVRTTVEVNNQVYKFVIEKQDSVYIITYKRQTISAVINDNDEFEYSY